MKTIVHSVDNGPVALNRGYNLLRGIQREEQRLAGWDMTPLAQDPDQAAIRREEQMEVRMALARLPERQSRLLLLRHAGLSYMSQIRRARCL